VPPSSGSSNPGLCDPKDEGNTIPWNTANHSCNDPKKLGNFSTNSQIYDKQYLPLTHVDDLLCLQLHTSLQSFHLTHSCTYKDHTQRVLFEDNTGLNTRTEQWKRLLHLLGSNITSYGTSNWDFLVARRADELLALFIEPLARCSSALPSATSEQAKIKQNILKQIKKWKTLCSLIPCSLLSSYFHTHLSWLWHVNSCLNLIRPFSKTCYLE